MLGNSADADSIGFGAVARSFLTRLESPAAFWLDHSTWGSQHSLCESLAHRACNCRQNVSRPRTLFVSSLARSLVTVPTPNEPEAS